MDSVAYILIFGCCLISVMTIGVVVAVAYQRRVAGPRPQAQAVLRQLAEQMELAHLNSQRRYRYGGMHQDHAFYIDLGMTGAVSSHSISLGRAIEVSVEVQMRAPQPGYAYCNRGRVSPTTSFEAAFRARLKYEWLSPAAREAMLAFVRKHDNLFLEGLPIHPKPQPQPEAKVRVQHNIGTNTQITPDQVRAVLDELVEVARVIETTC
jgi:hypothetical protein